MFINISSMTTSTNEWRIIVSSWINDFMNSLSANNYYFDDSNYVLYHIMTDPGTQSQFKIFIKKTFSISIENVVFIRHRNFDTKGAIHSQINSAYVIGFEITEDENLTKLLLKT